MTGSIWVAERGGNYDWSRASDSGTKFSLEENTNVDKRFVVQFGLTFRVAKGSISLTRSRVFRERRVDERPLPGVPKGPFSTRVSCPARVIGAGGFSPV